jgi:hypothetical protein
VGIHRRGSSDNLVVDGLRAAPRHCAISRGSWSCTSVRQEEEAVSGRFAKFVFAVAGNSPSLRPHESDTGWCLGIVRAIADGFTVHRSMASSRLPHDVLSAVYKCRPVGAARHPSRRHVGRRAGWHRPSGSTVRLQQRQLTLRRCCGISASRSAAIEVLDGSAEPVSSRRARQYSGGRSSSGARAGFAEAILLRAAAIFSICLMLGMRQLAGRSVMLH